MKQNKPTQKKPSTAAAAAVAVTTNEKITATNGVYSLIATGNAFDFTSHDSDLIYDG